MRGPYSRMEDLKEHTKATGDCPVVLQLICPLMGPKFFVLSPDPYRIYDFYQDGLRNGFLVGVWMCLVDTFNNVDPLKPTSCVHFDVEWVRKNVETIEDANGLSIEEENNEFRTTLVEMIKVVCQLTSTHTAKVSVTTASRYSPSEKLLKFSYHVVFPDHRICIEDMRVFDKLLKDTPRPPDSQVVNRKGHSAMRFLGLKPRNPTEEVKNKLLMLGEYVQDYLFEYNSRERFQVMSILREMARQEIQDYFATEGGAEKRRCINLSGVYSITGSYLNTLSDTEETTFEMNSSKLMCTGSSLQIRPSPHDFFIQKWHSDCVLVKPQDPVSPKHTVSGKKRPSSSVTKTTPTKSKMEDFSWVIQGKLEKLKLLLGDTNRYSREIQIRDGLYVVSITPSSSSGTRKCLFYDKGHGKSPGYAAIVDTEDKQKVFYKCYSSKCTKKFKDIELVLL